MKLSLFIKCLVLQFGLLLFGGALVNAQQETILFEADTSEQAWYGWSVDISENYAVVGAPQVNNERGVGYLYRKDNEGWTEEGEHFSPLDFEPGVKRFGRVVSVDGKTIAGSNLQEDNGNGEVRLFEIENSGTKRIDKKIPDDRDWKKFGNAIDISSSYIFVGRSDGFSGGGEIYLYTESSDNSQLTFNEQRIRPLECPEGLICKPVDKEHFGTAVSVNGNYAVISSPAKDKGSGGVVYIYKKEQGEWKRQEMVYRHEDDTTETFFGANVSINRDYLVVSDPENMEVTDEIADMTMGGGAVYVYSNTENGWVFDQKLLHDEVYASDEFGWSIEINDNNLLAIGHWDSDHDSTSSGYLTKSGYGLVHIYQKKEGQWQPVEKIHASDSSRTDLFGRSIGLNHQNQLIVGSPGNDDVADDADGAAYVYDLGTFTDLEDTKISTPDQFALKQNYPNPFNPSTNIPFKLAEAGKVTLNIYSIVGQKVETLISKKMSAGSHSVTFNASDLSSGVYLYSLKFNGENKTNKMMLVK